MKDTSFESLARMFDETGIVQVQFAENITPHTDTRRRIIWLPDSARRLTIEKRFELMCYILHEIGHLCETHVQLNEYDFDKKHMRMANLLEDLKIQPFIEKTFGASREIFEYTIGKIMENKAKMNMFYEQKIMDHVILLFTNFESAFYDEEIGKEIKTKEQEIRRLFEEWCSIGDDYDTTARGEESWFSFMKSDTVKRRANGNTNMRKNVLNKLWMLLMDDEHERKDNKKRREEQQKVRDAQHETEQRRRDIRNELDKKAREAEDAVEESLRKTKDLQNRKKQTASKQAKKIINKKLKEELAKRKEKRELKEKAKEEYSRARHGVYPEDEILDKLKKQEQEALDNWQSIEPNSCVGLNQVKKQEVSTGKSFFSRSEKFKASSRTAIVRLFSKMAEEMETRERGAINTKRIAQFFDEEKLFKETVKKPRVKASISFLIDASGSIGHNREIIWKAFESVIQATQRATKQDLADVEYEVRFFHDSDVVGKLMKTRHSTSVIKKVGENYANMTLGGTRLYESLFNAWRSLKPKAGRKRIIFILTDGQISDGYGTTHGPINAANAKYYGEQYPPIETQDWYKNMRRSGVNIAFLGFGRSVPEKFLGEFDTLPIKDAADIEPCLVKQVERIVRS